ncbi:MAG: histidine--tRNA ligase [Acidobacteriota bacterium]|nr:histidine--tRNA ligase [Acidobacteriota bacterium]
MSKTIRNVKGTRDLLPPSTALWTAVEEVARRVFGLYGYQEIRTPILEHTDLFVRGIGASTDIVGKEMFSFEDRKGRNLSLRPEGTAPVVRAFIQRGEREWVLPARLFYIGQHFRYERPQKGRYRQFQQIGAELLGDPGPFSDAELIVMLVAFLSCLGFRDLEVAVNTVGDPDSRRRYRQALLEYLSPLREALGEESRKRLETNPLRILDTKSPSEKELLRDAPGLEVFLNRESREHFETVCSLLGRSGVEYRIEPHLVRGLDYYSRTVFEISATGLGAHDAIVGGGRYDGLLAALGGPDLPAIGFAIGQDRLMEILPQDFQSEAAGTRPVVVIPIEPLGAEAAWEVAAELRAGEVPAVAELTGSAVKSALKRAARAGTRWVVLVGEDELSQDGVVLRDLEAGEQSFVRRAELVEGLRGTR